jgi:hypothetical protein
VRVDFSASALDTIDRNFSMMIWPLIRRRLRGS